MLGCMGAGGVWCWGVRVLGCMGAGPGEKIHVVTRYNA